MLIDGTHVRIESSSDREWNRLTYAGKVKCHSYNKNYYVDPGGLYIGKSPAVPGSMHDFRLLKENLPKFGWLTKIRLRNDLPEWARPNIVVDKGYVGIDKLLPGARIWIPVKMGAGSDEGGELSQKDLDHNREVAQVRYVVEVAVGPDQAVRRNGRAVPRHARTVRQGHEHTPGPGQPQDAVAARQGGPTPTRYEE